MRVIRKLLIPTLLFVGLIIAGLIAYNAIITVQQFELDEAQRLENMHDVFLAQILSQENLAVALSMKTANNLEVKKSFAERDRERLIELTLPGYEAVHTQFGVPQHQFHIAPATSFLRLHNLENFDDDLSSFRFTILVANAEKRIVSGIELGRAGLGVRGVVPVTYEGEHIGSVEFGTNVGIDLLETMKKEFGYEWQILLNRDLADIVTSVDAGEAENVPEQFLLQASTLSVPFFAVEENYKKALTGEASIEQISIGELEYTIYSTPLYDFSGNAIGIIDIISDHTAITTQQNNQMLLSLGILIIALLIVGIGFSAIANRTLRPIGQLNTTASAIAEGNFSQRAEIKSDDEIGDLAQAFNTMTEQLQGLFGTLEERVTNATRDLTLAAEVGRSLSQSRDIETLLTDAVALIQDRFNMYYTQAYLVDESGRQLILRAGTGAVGQQLLNRRHTLPIDLASLNGTAAIERRAVIIENTEESIVHRPNPLLPETRSEMVVPLIAGNRVVGVLDMQSNEAGALSQENLAAFEALAGQIAIAIQNVELLGDAESARVELEAQAQRLIHSGWRNYLNAVERGERIGYRYDNENMTPFTDEIVSSVDAENLTATIHVSNEPIGILQFEGLETWTNEETTLVNDVAEQLGKQVESLRLLDQADRYRAEAEGALRHLTREGWQSHFDARETAQTSFSYDLNTVTPILDDSNTETNIPSSTHSLEVAGEKIGEISISGSDSSNREVDDMLSTVSGYLSARIENLRLFEETERGQLALDKRARELATVAEVSTAASTTLDTDKLLQDVVDLTRERFNLYHSHIFLLGEDEKSLQVAACGWEEGSTLTGTHGDSAIPLDAEKSIVANVARTRQAVIVNDVRDDPHWLPNELMPNTRSEMAVPLIVGENLIGVFDIQSDQANRFTEEDIDIQTTLASQIATALQNARSYTQAQKQADRETTLNIISQKIQSATSVEAVLQIAARELGHALDAPMTIAQLSMKDQK